MEIQKKIEQGALILAPMAGITDSTFRKLCIEQGADVVYSEMVSLQALYYGDKKTKNLIEHTKEERPFVLQIFGRDPDVAKRVVGEQLNALEGVDALDINMGCPAPKIIKSGAGAFHLRDVKKALLFIDAVIKESRFPVSVKLRLGWDTDMMTGTDLAEGAQELGVSWIAVHGRTREQYYSGTADWMALRDLRLRIRIPFVANGDIFTPEDAKIARNFIHPNSLMIGRGAYGNPWIFKQMKDHLDGRIYNVPNYEEVLAMARTHLEQLVIDKGEMIAVKEIRKHLAWYFKGLYQAAEMRNISNTLQSQSEILALLNQYERLLRRRLDKQ